MKKKKKPGTFVFILERKGDHLLTQFPGKRTKVADTNLKRNEKGTIESKRRKKTYLRSEANRTEFGITSARGEEGGQADKDRAKNHICTRKKEVARTFRIRSLERLKTRDPINRAEKPQGTFGPFNSNKNGGGEIETFRANRHLQGNNVSRKTWRPIQGAEKTWGTEGDSRSLN